MIHIPERAEDIEFDPKKPWSPKSIEGVDPKEFEPAESDESFEASEAILKARKLIQEFPSDPLAYYDFPVEVSDGRFE